MPSRKTFPIVYIAAYITLTFFAHLIITHITFVAKEEKITYTLLRFHLNHILEITNAKWKCLEKLSILNWKSVIE